MRNPAESLEEQQAVAKRLGAAAELVAGQLQVVGIGIEAAERQLEAVLAARRAVAGTAVATADVEGGDHVVAEADRRRLVEVAVLDRNPRDLGADLDGQRRLAGSGGDQIAPFVRTSDLVRIDGDLGDRRQIADHKVPSAYLPVTTSCVTARGICSCRSCCMRHFDGNRLADQLVAVAGVGRRLGMGKGRQQHGAENREDARRHGGSGSPGGARGRRE